MSAVLQALSATFLTVTCSLVVASVIAYCVYSIYTWDTTTDPTFQDALKHHTLHFCGLPARTLWSAWVVISIVAWISRRLGFQRTEIILDWSCLALVCLMILAHFLWAARILRCDRDCAALLRYARHVLVWSGLALVLLGFGTYHSLPGSNQAVERTAR